MKTVIYIMMLVVLIGCEDTGSTGNVTRYARSMRGCGNGRDEAQMWYVDDFGDTLTGAGNRLARVGELFQAYCDDYGTPGFPVGVCEQVGLRSVSITDEAGRVSINAIRQTQGNCDGHRYNMEHQASGQWGIPTLAMTSFFSYGGNPPDRSPIFMVPSDSCPVVNKKPPTLVTSRGPISSKSAKALSAPTSGGAPTAMLMGPVEVDPNAIVLPTSGIEWDIFLVRQYNDHAIAEYEVSASNSNHWEDNYRYQYPCVYEILVMCAEPVDPTGLVADGYVITDLLPDGIPVELSPVTSNDDQTVWLFTTDKFLPVQPDVYIDLYNDPNEHVIFDRWTPVSAEEQYLYDPNLFEDPNDCMNYTIDTMAPDFMDRHDTTRVLPMEYLPCNDIDTIRFQFTPGVETVVTVLGSWLQQDYNVGGEDGFVDMNDWATIFNY